MRYHFDIQSRSFLGKVQKCSMVKPVNGNPILLLLVIGSPTLVQIHKQRKKKKGIVVCYPIVYIYVCRQYKWKW